MQSARQYGIDLIAPETEALIDWGLKEGSGNTHGPIDIESAFSFGRTHFELFWEYYEEEARKGTRNIGAEL